MGGGLSRRSFLKSAGALGVLSVLPAALVRDVVGRTAEAAEPHYFLDAHQYATVQALCRRLIPGPQDDPTEPDPGALEANVIAYIDLFLGAFNIPAPAGPRIWGDGPFSGRAGPPPWPFAGSPPSPYPDDFARTSPLSAVEVLSWRTLLEGTKGLPERKWADVAAGGHYVGLQEQYVQGVKDLDTAASQMFPPAKDFVSLTPQQQDVLIARPDITAGFPSLVFQHAAHGPVLEVGGEGVDAVDDEGQRRLSDAEEDRHRGEPVGLQRQQPAGGEQEPHDGTEAGQLGKVPPGEPHPQGGRPQHGPQDAFAHRPRRLLGDGIGTGDDEGQRGLDEHQEHHLWLQARRRRLSPQSPLRVCCGITAPPCGSAS